MKGLALAVLTILALACQSGCSSKPQARQTGFLSNYSDLKPVNAQRMVYISPQFKEYDAYMIDSIEFRMPPKKLKPQERAEVANYFNKRLVELVEKEGLTVATMPGVGVARVSVALTDVAESTWWKKLHPVARMSGAGTGGAAMEAEVVDSVTGEQLAAVVQTSTGNQFDFTAFSTVSDVKSAIDKWAAQASVTLKELRADAR